MLCRGRKKARPETPEYNADRPPPYSENSPDADSAPGIQNNAPNRSLSSQVEDYISDAFGALDLLSPCNLVPNADEVDQDIDREAPGEEMGHKHSSLFTGNHRSKISLTWVLREQLESRNGKGQRPQDYRRRSDFASVDRYQRHNQKFDENLISERVIGRNDYSHRTRSHSKSERICGNGERHSSSGSSADRSVSQRRHRHRRRKSRALERPISHFGYDIKDIDNFLTEATIDRPGNIPVVVTSPSILYQTQGGKQIEVSLQLGMVVNAVFKKQQWLYVQTPHGEEGYVAYCACLPLGVLPAGRSPAPCWESSRDLFPRPGGNRTDSDKEQMRGAQSDCGRRSRPKKHTKNYPASTCGERTFDRLYIKAAALKGISPSDDDEQAKAKRKLSRQINRHFLLYVNADYDGNDAANTLTVRENDVVILIQGSGIEADVDSEWFYVRKNDGTEGFIPASITGHGFL